MIDAQKEEMLSLAAAAREVPGRSGRGVNVSTVWRWVQRGIRGVRLETLVCGGVRFTSRQAIQRFFVATTVAADGVPSQQIATPKQRQRQIAAAERDLAEAGI